MDGSIISHIKIFIIFVGHFRCDQRMKSCLFLTLNRSLLEFDTFVCIKNLLCDFMFQMAEVDPETLLEWLSIGQGDERDMQLIALEQLCMLLLMSDNVDRCFER